MGKKRKKSSQGQAADVVSEAMASALAPTPPPAEARVEIEAAPVAIEAIAPVPVPEPARSQPALTEEKAAELIASAPELIEPAPQLDAPPSSVAAPASEAAPSTSRPRKRRKKRVTKPPVSREVLDQKIDRLEAKLEVKKTQAAKAAREGFDSTPGVDDTSVPPVEQEIHEEFFAAGEKDHPLPRAESGPYSALDLRHAQKMTPAAHARRAHLSRYVKWSVGAAALILLLGIVGQRLRGGHQNDEPVRREVTHNTQLAAPPPQETPTAVTPPPADTTMVAEMKIEELPDEVLGGDGGKVEGKVEDPDKKPEDMPAEKPKNAWQEKQAAKAALERGANGAAIAAGERSVALDPSDGEAWLVLGGAYQAMSNNAQAKRCYKACISQGTKGPTGDCKDMLGSL